MTQDLDPVALLRGTELDVVALRRQQTVRLPDDTRLRLQFYRGHTYALFKQMKAETDAAIRAAQMSELLRAALPDATEDQLMDLGPEDWAIIVYAAAGKIVLMEGALGNGGGGDGAMGAPPAPAPDSTASTTTTTSPPSAPASAAPSA